MLPVLSVSEFINQINGIILGEFTIEGEVSQYKVSQGKWIFFDLKDETSVLSCFSTVFMLRQPLEDGMRVRVKGYPKIHEKSGRFSFTVQSVELIGQGSLQRAYQLLKIKLEKEGLFAPERKRSLPRFPERVGIIASLDSAAYGDFKRIANNRWGGVELVTRNVAVQGEMAVTDIVGAFQEFNENAILCDVLVLIRGGGSLEDLAAFNDEAVARAVYSSRIPVVVGVGHERDESLADFVADVRASTPSNAAERVLPERREVVSELTYTLEQMEQSIIHMFAVQRQEIKQAETAMAQALLRRFAAFKHELTNAETLFKNVDPKRILKRGFSIVRTGDGTLVREAKQVDTGDALMIELAKGEIKGKVL
jgi:exodeoxyribonuclease VII large subunit